MQVPLKFEARFRPDVDFWPVEVIMAKKVRDAVYVLFSPMGHNDFRWAHDDTGEVSRYIGHSRFALGHGIGGREVLETSAMLGMMYLEHPSPRSEWQEIAKDFRKIYGKGRHQTPVQNLSCTEMDIETRGSLWVNPRYSHLVF